MYTAPLMVKIGSNHKESNDAKKQEPEEVDELHLKNLGSGNRLGEIVQRAATFKLNGRKQSSNDLKSHIFIDIFQIGVVIK